MNVSKEAKLSLLQSVKISQFQSIIWKSTKEPILTIQLLKSKKDGKDQKTIQSSTTPDPDITCESNKNTINIHKHENHVGVDKVTLTRDDPKVLILA